MMPDMEALRAVGEMLSRGVLALESIAASLESLAAVHGGGRPLPASILEDVLLAPDEERS